MTPEQRKRNWTLAAERVDDTERLYKSITATGPLRDYELNADEKRLVQSLCLTVLDEIKARGEVPVVGLDQERKP